MAEEEEKKERGLRTTPIPKRTTASSCSGPVRGRRGSGPRDQCRPSRSRKNHPFKLARLSYSEVGVYTGLFFLICAFRAKGKCKGRTSLQNPSTIHPSTRLCAGRCLDFGELLLPGDATEGNERVVIPGLGLSRERTSLLKCLSRMLVTCDPQSQTQLPATTPLPNRTQTSRHQTHYSLIHIYTIHNPKTKV